MRRAASPRRQPMPANVVPFPAAAAAPVRTQSGAEAAAEAHRERCRDGYVWEHTPLGKVRTICGVCRPTEVRNYDGGTARVAQPISEAERIRRYAGQGSQVWYPHLQVKEEA